MEYTCIDSFCGAGGLGLGLQQAGFRLLLSFDIDEHCIRSFQANDKYFHHPAVQADIADMLGGKLRERCGLKRGAVSSGRGTALPGLFRTAQRQRCGCQKRSGAAVREIGG